MKKRLTKQTESKASLGSLSDKLQNTYVLTVKKSSKLLLFLSILALSTSLFFFIYYRFMYASPFARTWDEVDFALALGRFDLLAMQPHFPGYPYFILGGMFFHQWIENPAKALSIFNVLLTASTIIPIYYLARTNLSLFNSLVSTLFVHSMTYIWIITTQPMSEAAAIAVLWWYLWMIKLAMSRKYAFLFAFITVFLFGFLMGIRLSFLPFGLGILLLLFYHWKMTKIFFIKHIVILIGMAIIFQFLWVGGLILSEGSLEGFIQLALGFVNGHFNEWGGAITTTQAPLLERVIQLLFYNFLWVGLFGQSILSAIGMSILIALSVRLAYLFYRNNLKGRLLPEVFHFFDCWLLFLFFAYFLWALFAQNIEKPRHISPLIGLFVLLVNKAFLDYAQKLCLQRYKMNKGLKLSKSKLMIIYLVTLALIVNQSLLGMKLIQEQANEMPATYQLATELSHYQEPLIVYTWEETRVMEFHKVEYQHKRIKTYELFIEDIRHRDNQRIFITNHVLQGFESQVGELQNQVVKIKQFNSNPLFDPIYSEIVLYEWVKD
jgi:hypothetical protein